MRVSRWLSEKLYIGLQWFPPWAYNLPESGRIFGWLPIRVWLYSTAHDSESYFWRICGLEINMPKQGRS